MNPVPHDPKRFVREIPPTEAMDLVMAAARGLFHYHERPAPKMYQRDARGRAVGPLRAAVVGPLKTGNVAVVWMVGTVENWPRAQVLQADEERPLFVKAPRA